MTEQTSRRTFLASSAIAASTIVDRHVLGAPFTAPSDKTTLAHIGMGTQGFNELGGLLRNPLIRIVAVCDPNEDSNDYVDWGPHGVRHRIRDLLGDPSWREGVPGIPGGREIGRQVVDAFYAREAGGARGKGCASYADFRELLEREKDIDAVKIMTPDHLHAAIAIAALKKGIHAITHKPLANRMHEARVLMDTVRATGVNTYFLAYISGEAAALAKTWIDDGAIGTLREIHNWSNRPVWPQYPALPADRPPVPKGFDWELWLGPSRSRPYHPCYTHAVFRGWYEFGGGSLADMGHYSLWPVFTAFDLDAPVSVEAWSSHTCVIENNVSHPLHNDVSFPAANTVKFTYPARGARGALDLYWYDGGMRPVTPDELEEDGGILPREGMMFVGEKGKILGGFLGENPRIIPARRMREYEQSASPGRRAGERRSGAGPWLDAFRGGPPSPGDFRNAGPITWAVNLGAVAIRAGGKIVYDHEAMKITNRPEANRYFHREYRPGWEL